MWKHYKSALLGCGLVLVGLSTTPTGKAQDILVADFESSSYGAWTATGAAFGNGPAAGTLPNQNPVTGFLGSKLLNSFLGGDISTGTLTSPAFTVQRRYLRFLVGGGNDRERTSVNLLRNGVVVRSSVGMGDRETLDWVQWDVSDLSGQSVQLRVVDMSTGGWGHINADHFLQTDSSLGGLRITNRFLHLPVRTGNSKRLFELLDQGLVTHEFNIELAQTNPEFHVFLDLQSFQGRDLQVRVDSALASSEVMSVLQQSAKLPNEPNIYREPLRPLFHYTARRGWLNDPNGLVFKDGEYHMGYQHNPYGWSWDNMHWGYAVSTNLVDWRELPEALYPDPLGAMWSGSTVVDVNNTAGFGARALVAFYTAAGGPSGVLPRMSRTKNFSQCLAWSVDSGRTWAKYTGNPVLPNVAGDNRDPKVFWHAPANKWVMVLWLDGSDFAIFNSLNLKDWVRTSTFSLPGVIEVPDLFPLALDGNAGQVKWVFYAGAGSYFIGSFDGSTFTPDAGPFSIRNGNCFAATQTFGDIPSSDGRRILIVHGTAQFPGMPFNNNMNFPVELSLKSTESGSRIFVNPVRELGLLRVSTNTWSTQTLMPGSDPLHGTTGEALEMDVRFRPGNATSLSFHLRGTTVTYDVAQQKLICGGSSASLSPTGGEVRLQILVDRGIIEIFGNSGRVYMPMKVTPVSGELPIGCSVIGTGAQLSSLSIHKLRSAFLPPGSGAPAVSSPPQSTSTVKGGVARFSISAIGDQPFSFQWRKDGVALPDHRASSLELFPVSEASAGEYDVVLSNPGGAVTSAVAVLTILPSYPLARWSMDPAGANSPAVLDSKTAPGEGQQPGAEASAGLAMDHLWTFNAHEDAFFTTSAVPPASMFANGATSGANAYDASRIRDVDGCLFYPQDIYGNEFSFEGAFTIELLFRTHGLQHEGGPMQLLSQGEWASRYGLCLNEPVQGGLRFTVTNGQIQEHVDLAGINFADGKWRYAIAAYDSLTGPNGSLRMTVVDEQGRESSAERLLSQALGPLPISNDGNLFLGRLRYPVASDHRTLIGDIDEVQVSAGVVREARLGHIPSTQHIPKMLSIESAAAEVGLALRWSSVSGALYQVQWCQRLSNPWATIASLSAFEDTASWQDTDPARTRAPSGFYRILVPW